jgi:hypothetical protein
MNHDGTKSTAEDEAGTRPWCGRDKTALKFILPVYYDW